MIKEINQCRICGNSELKPVINLGIHSLTGIFPRKKDEIFTSGPLELIRCDDEFNPDACGLLQLRHSYDLNELYGQNYGYRSGLNNSMLAHLKTIVDNIQALVDFEKDDLILDIGSNDGSLLSFYPISKGLNLVGIDPTGEKFRKFYQERINLIPTFFSANEIKRNFSTKRIKVITSIAMFYDLEEPMQFMKEIFEVLDDDGVWILEQSYMPSMLKATAYDTICHEHLEYYSLKQIKWMADRVGLRIISVDLNDTNGGSFCITLAKKNSHYPEAENTINKTFLKETEMLLQTDIPYQKFTLRVADHKKQIRAFFNKIEGKNELLLGYGASTKGNVILQYCGLTKKEIPYIAEVNSDKFGCFTPGTFIPIISETEARKMNPDYFFVLPWHFRTSIVGREKKYIDSGGKLVFPLPEISTFSSMNSSAYQR